MPTMHKCIAGPLNVASTHVHNWPCVYVGKGRQRHSISTFWSKLHNDAGARCVQGLCSIELLLCIIIKFYIQTSNV